MKTFTSVIRYMSEREAIFQSEEESLREACSFQDKQKYRTGMIS